LPARRRGCRFHRFAAARGCGLTCRLLDSIQSQMKSQPVPVSVGMRVSLLGCVGGILCPLCLLDLCRVAGHTISTSINVASVVHGVVDVWLTLDEEVTARGLVAQSALEVLQLAQEVEVWRNGGPALFHKSYKGTDRKWVRAHSQMTCDQRYNRCHVNRGTIDVL